MLCGSTKTIGCIRATLLNVLKQYRSFNNIETHFFSKEIGFCREILLKNLGNSVKINFSLYVDYDIKDFVLGFVLKDQTGSPILGLNNKNSTNQIFFLSKGIREFSLEIGTDSLIDGDYGLDFYFGTGVSDFEIISDKINFKVSHNFKYGQTDIDVTLNKFRTNDIQFNF